VIDVLNQSRQSDLALEKHWVTKDGFFRIVTTLFGVTVVDAWKGYVWHCGPNHRHRKMHSIAPPARRRQATDQVEDSRSQREGLLDDDDDDDEDTLEVGGVQNNSQFSDLTMDPGDFPTPPSSFQTPTRHSLVRTKQKEAYAYSVCNMVGVVSGLPCFQSYNRQMWILK